MTKNHPLNYRLSAVLAPSSLLRDIATVPTTTVHTIEQPTGYSAPASEQNASYLYSSGSSSATAKAAPYKKQRATPAAPALVATHANISLHNASQTIVSSGSEVQSVTSSTERLRREKLAKAKFENAERRVMMAQANLDLAIGSQAGSVGRLVDATSEGGNSTRARPRSCADLAAPTHTI